MLPVGEPGPRRLSWKAAAMPLGNVTASLKVTLIDVTIDRWTPPPLTATDTTVGGAASETVSKAPMSVAAPLVRLKPLPRWSNVRAAGLDPASIAGLPAFKA